MDIAFDDINISQCLHMQIKLCTGGSQARSGLDVKHECVEAYMKIKKEKKVRFVVFKCSDDLKTVEVDFVPPATGEPFEDQVTITQEGKEPLEYTFFRQKMTPSGECRYGVYDLTWQEADKLGGKMCFIACSYIKKMINPDGRRCPDSSGIKKKMIYASSKDAVAKKLEGIQVNIQCNDLDEISYAEVVEEASKGKAKF